MSELKLQKVFVEVDETELYSTHSSLLKSIENKTYKEQEGYFFSKEELKELIEKTTAEARKRNIYS